jgi:Spx/MgsR family transcriptional regulator
MERKIYGMPYCDSTKATMKAFEQQNIAFELHDYKTNGITEEKVKSWLEQVPADKLLNKKSTTWRGLSPQEQALANDPATLPALLQQHTSLIKWPVVELNGKVETVGLPPGIKK